MNIVVNKGDRIAQLILEKILIAPLEECEVWYKYIYVSNDWTYQIIIAITVVIIDNNCYIFKLRYSYMRQDLDKTDRGAGGFGSTGTNW